MSADCNASSVSNIFVIVCGAPTGHCVIVLGEYSSNFEVFEVLGGRGEGRIVSLGKLH